MGKEATKEQYEKNKVARANKRKGRISREISNVQEAKLQPKLPKKDVAAGGIQGKKGGGGGEAEAKEQGPPKAQALDATVRAKLEKSLGQKFGDVKIIANDPKVAQKGAKAYTQNKTIHFAPGEYDPKSEAGQELIGHELAHVVQQNKGAAKKGKAQKKGPGEKGALEKEASAAGKKAAKGEKASVKGAAGKGPQNEDDEQARTTQYSIPLPGGQSIRFQPGTDAETFQVTALGPFDLWKMDDPVKKKKEIRKNIPTPFFGLALQLGMGADVSFGLPAVTFEGVSVSGNKRTGDMVVNGEFKAGLAITGRLYLKAGVAVDAWIAEAGVGLKAFMSLGLETALSAKLQARYNVRTGKLHFEVPWSLQPEIALKAGVALYAYYDAWGVSTYEKEWNLAERTLGKLSLPGIKGCFSTDRTKKMIEPADPSFQGIRGRVRNLFPRRS